MQDSALPLSGIERIAAERQRQVDDEGYSPGHDAQHSEMDLSKAAVIYVHNAVQNETGVRIGTDMPWPWEREGFAPSTNAIRDLEKAGALIAAEIDRIIANRERGER